MEIEDRDKLIGIVNQEELSRSCRLPKAQVQPAYASETAYLCDLSKGLKELIRQLQKGDLETQRRKTAITQANHGFKGWLVGYDTLLRFKEYIYILRVYYLQGRQPINQVGEESTKLNYHRDCFLRKRDSTSLSINLNLIVLV